MLAAKQEPERQIEDAAAIWAQACEVLSRELPVLFFDHFIRPIQARIQEEDRRFFLLTSDSRSCQHIDIKYGLRIREVVRAFLPSDYMVELGSEDGPGKTTGPGPLASAKDEVDGRPGSQGALLESHIQSDSVLDESSPGSPAGAGGQNKVNRESNREWELAGTLPFICDDGVRSSLEPLFNQDSGLFYVQGPSGCGKTHLGRILCLSGNARILGMEEFLVSFATASREGNLLEWKKGLNSCSTLIIDDLQFLRSKAVRTREQLRALMDAALIGKLKLVLMADQSPSQIDGGADLRSRLLEARPISLPYLGEERRRDLLRNLALKQNVEIPRDCLELLAERISGDHRKLQNAIHRLAIHPDQAHSTAWLKNEMADLMQNVEAADPERILSMVCKFYSVHPDLVRSDARDQAVVRARHLCAYFLHRRSGMKLSGIAAFLGRKDHSAVLYGIRKMEDRFREDLFLRRQVQTLEARILEG